MLVNLPGALELTCPQCSKSFTTKARHLDAQDQVKCPFCDNQFGIYQGLAGRLKRKVYHAVRDELEHRVYTEITKDLPAELRDWSGLIPASEDDGQS